MVIVALIGMRHINLEASVSFKSLGKKIDKNSTIAGLSFGIEKGSFFSIFGASSSGKSSILKLISGIIYKDKGYLYINGKDINVNPVDIKYDIGYMPQKIDLYNNLNLLENIILYTEFFNLSWKKSKDRAKLLCEKLNIQDYIYKYPNQNNLCINRMAIFIRSIIHNPDIVLLDQPTLDMDLEYRNYIWDFLSNDNSKTIIYSTNNLKEVEKNCDRMAYIDNCSIKYIGQYDSFLESKINYSISNKNGNLE